MNIVYRELKEHELEKFHEIDRSERVEEIYKYESGKIVLYPEGFIHNGFTKEEREKTIKGFRKILENNGVVIGAFSGDKLVGITSLENRLFGKNKNKVNMEVLYTDSNSRGLGIGRSLINSLKPYAKKFGAEIIYISATASKNSVNFYMNSGAELSTDVDPYLYEKEDDDIHMELKI